MVGRWQQNDAGDDSILEAVRTPVLEDHAREDAESYPCPLRVIGSWTKMQSRFHLAGLLWYATMLFIL